MKKEINGKIAIIIFFAGLMIFFHLGDLYSIGILEQSGKNAKSTLDFMGSGIILLAFFSIKKNLKKIRK